MEFKLSRDQANALMLLQGIRDAKMQEILAIDRSMAEVARSFSGEEAFEEYGLEQRHDGYYIVADETAK